MKIENEVPESGNKINFVNKCSICHEIFSAVNTLKTHIYFTHILYSKENNSFECPICGKSTSRKTNIQRYCKES